MRLVEGNIEANEELHPLNSLIGCNEGHGPNVAVWCKARSAHLYRQSQIFERDGLDLGRSTLADWGEARSLNPSSRPADGSKG
jgi:transposase